jgi:general secretion pathway protein L
MSRGPAQRLLVFLPPWGSLREGGTLASPSPATVVAYAGIDASQRQRSAGDAPLTRVPQAVSVDLLFDVSDLFTALLDAPRMSEGRLRQALPGLIEERLLTDAADCHLAHRLEDSGENLMRVAVAAIDRGTLTHALQAAGEAQLPLRSAYSSLYSIPAPSAGTLSVRLSRGRGTVRTAEHSGFAFDLDGKPPVALSIAVQQLKIRRIHAYGRDARKLVPFVAPLGVKLLYTKRDFDAISIAGALNVLQGPFALAGPLGMPTVAVVMASNRLKPLLAWAAASMAVFVLGLNAVHFKLESETRALRSSMQTAFRSAFPSEAVVDPVVQAQRHLRDLRARAGLSSPDDFSVLNAKAVRLLSGAPVGALAGIEYRDAALTLKFKPGAANSAGFRDALRAQAVKQGLNVSFDADGSARIAPTIP